MRLNNRLIKLLVTGTIAFFLCVTSTAQELLNKQISLYSKGERLSTVLSVVEQKSGVSFSYASNVVDTKRTVAITAKDASLNEILSSLFTGTSVGFSEVGNQIILYRKKSGAIATPAGFKTERVLVSEIQEQNNSLGNSPKDPIIDTLFVIDTTMIYDTIAVSVYDTSKITITDTILIYSEKQSKKRESKLASDASFAIYIAGGSVFPTTKYSENAGSDSLFSIMQSAQGKSDGGTAQISIQYIKQNIRISLGWQYLRLTEWYTLDTLPTIDKTIFAGTTQSIEWKTRTIDTIQTEDGTNIILKDSIPIQTEKKHVTTIQSANRLQKIQLYYVCIPIELAYHFANKKKISYDFGIVGQSMFAIASSGTIYSSSQAECVNYSTQTVQLHVMNIGPSIGLNYSITNNVFVNLQCQYLKDVLKLASNATIKKQTDFAQILIGFGVQL